MQSQLEPMQAAFESFTRAYPAYRLTRAIDQLRASEYSRLDRLGHIYLDYTGGGLYADSQLRKHSAMLSDAVFGNPHSKNLTSTAMTALVESTRDTVLRFFNASPAEYTAIFTPNATGALRLVGESYPFAPGGTYLLTSDNHNSVNGIREFAKHKGARVNYVPLRESDLRLDSEYLAGALRSVVPAAANLFAYPAQSNFTGVKHPLEYISIAHEHGWDVLLDAASFVPTNRLDLTRWHPDYVDISFYKIFGYPTGLGCLLVRHAALEKLHRPWYSGGTITFSSVAANNHYLTPGPAGFEDGTVNYLSIPAVEFGIQLVESIGMDVIRERVMTLTGWLMNYLLGLAHSNGKPVIRVFGPANTLRRGAAIAMNFFDPCGSMFDCTAVEQMANAERISLRAGCHCNPGARETAFGMTREVLEPCFWNKESRTYEDFLRGIENNMTGAVRVSLGLVSNFADVHKFARFAETFVDRRVSAKTNLQFTALREEKIMQSKRPYSHLNSAQINRRIIAPQHLA